MHPTIDATDARWMQVDAGTCIQTCIHRNQDLAQFEESFIFFTIRIHMRNIISHPRYSNIAATLTHTSGFNHCANYVRISVLP